MGRSVIPHPDATVVAYRTHEPDETYYRQGFEDQVEEGWLDADDDFEDWMYSVWNDADSQHEWDNLVDWVRETVLEMFPSMYAVEDHDHNAEQTILARNGHSEVSISEYCGSVAVSLAATYDRTNYWQDPSEIAGLGENWRKQVASRFEKMFGEMQKIGTFSDGTSVYQLRAS